MPRLNAKVLAEYYGGPHHGRRRMTGAHKCDMPDCQVIHAPESIAHAVGGSLVKTEIDGQSASTEPPVGTYRLRHPEPVDGAYQYDWEHGEGTKPPAG